MEVVINVPDEVYQGIYGAYKMLEDRNLLQDTESSTESVIFKALYNGIPLPKGHGDLIDRNILLQNWEAVPSKDRLIFNKYIQLLEGVLPADKE